MPDAQDQLARRRAELNPDQRARLAARLRGEGVAPAHPAIPRLAAGESVPLSFAQQRLWFLWKLNTESAAYHLGGGLRLIGSLDSAALQASLDALVARHASLRTVFRELHDGGVEQVVMPISPVRLATVDLRNEPGGPDARELRLREQTEQLIEAPFDLASGPLLRAVLIHVAEQEYRLMVAMHHIVSDAHSTQIILDELSALYRAHLEQRTLQLPALPIQYVDYAAWQREWMAGPEAARQLDWWRAQLSQTFEALALATDRPRRADGRYSAATCRFVLDETLVASLRQRAQTLGGTLFAALLAAFQALLFRHSGGDEIRVGVPIANRNRAESSGVVGFFVNTQVLSARFDERMSLAHLLQTTAEASLGAQANQDLPFERLVEVLQPVRSLAHTPLFQVMFNHLRRDDGPLRAWPGVSVQRLDFETRAAQFELTLETCENAAGQVEAVFRYAAELFDGETVEQLAGHYQALLQALARQPQQAVADVDLLSDNERQQLRQWGGNSQRFAWVEPVQRLIERHAQQQPAAIALLFDEQQLTYAELNTQANRLAHHLMRCGVRPEIRVGIAVERSPEMVVGLLAILKAGGAYVPLDPDYPADRLAYLVEDSGIDLLLTQRRVRDRLPSNIAVRVLALDALAVNDEPTHNPDVAVGGDNLAYVIYTSGSTGKPKGAAIRHRSLVSCMRWMQHTYSLTAADAVLHKAPFGFDVSVWEIFWPLMAGVRLVVANPDDHRDPARIIDLIRRHGITTLNFVPAMLQAFLAQAGIETQTRLRYVICGGEAMPAATQREALRRLTGVSLQNLYGPTETTIHVTRWHCRDDDRHQVPIGRPIAETQTHVLNDALQPVPRGVAGELYLGGELLARGYLNRPALSAERFVADPFTARGGRLYRTGDLVRWNREGALEYLGRIDHQVKIRGFRIELGEVEAQLLAQPAVREAVVVAQPGPTGQRLVAYVSTLAAHELSAAELRQRLSERLPDYMVPAAIVLLERLPLNANGKVDRGALPAPEFDSARDYVQPLGAVEETLARIWAQVLDIERVGRHDNFFELGGDSILSLRIIAEVQRSGWKLAPRQLFERQTVAGLASIIELGTAGDERRPAVGERPNAPLVTLTPAQREALPMAEASIEEILPLTPMQQGMLLHTLLDRNSGMYLMQDRCNFRRQLDVDAFWASWDAVVDEHAALRASFVWEAGATQFQVIHRQVSLPKDYLDLRALRRDAAMAHVEEILRAERTIGFDPGKAPLMRVRLIRLSDTDFHLVISFHHMLMDAWCSTLLMNQVLSQYEARTRGAPPAREHTTPYRDLFEWLRQQDMDAARAYWQRRLAGFDQVTPLPMCRTPRASTGSSMIDLKTQLSPELTARLHAVAKRLQVTTNTLTQGAWGLVLAGYSGSRDILFGVTVAGRPADRPDLHRTIGLFINTIPLRLVLPAAASPITVAQWLRDIFVQNLESREFEYMPLLELQGINGLPRDRSLFDSLFVFENAPVETTLLERAQAWSADQNTTRTHTNFPMTVVVIPGAGMTLQLTYDERFFEAETVASLLNSFRYVVEQFVDCPSVALHRILVLPEAERRQLLALGEGARSAQPFDDGYVALFQKQVARHFERVAVRHRDRSITYAELDTDSDRVAWRLRHAGVGAGDVVMLFSSRDIDLVARILGCFKIGAAYLAVDVSLPARRLAQVVMTSGASVVLTDGAYIESLDDVWRALPDRGRAPRVVVASRADGLPGGRFRAVAVRPDQPAYVIFTSGSTGQPKGVVVTSRGMLNNQLSKVGGFPLGVDDVIAQTASQSFDISVWQLLGGLLCGAGIHIVDSEVVRDPPALLALMAAAGVTVLEAVPSLMQLILDGDAVALPRLRVTMATGEAVPVVLAGNWKARYPASTLINAYGPAECADDVALHVVPADAGDTSLAVRDGESFAALASFPIGNPVDNLRLYVLDHQLELVAKGVPGELYIGGAGVGQGYLNRPDLTAERFVANPFGDGDRLYRTGDVAKWSAEHRLEYLGRIDHQVKVRGFRIEPGEIEAQLLAQREVRQAVVVAQAQPTGSRLVAYVLATAAQDISVADLRERLRERLPDYMVPSAIVVLDSLPLNGNGKVDRKRLPAAAFVSERDYEAPQGAMEEALAQIWAELLGVERVGRHDSFFELGGHSLLALAVLHRMRQQGWVVPVGTIFEQPRLAAFARATLQSETHEVAVPPNGIPTHCEAIEPAMLTLIDLDADDIRRVEAAVPGGAANIQDIYPLAPLQEGILFHHMLRTDGDAYVLPHLLSFDSRERLQRFIADLNRVIARHDILRTAVLWDGLPEPLQVVYRQAQVQVRWLERAAAAGDAVAQINALVRPSHYRIDVRQAPMIHALALYDAERQRWLLQLPTHHLVLDHTTLELILEEIALIRRGRASALPEPVPFRRFVAQARLGLSERAHAAFFTRMLHGVDEPTAPFGLLDVQNDGSDIETFRLPLEASLSARIRQQAKWHGVSAASLFHLAWAQVLASTTGRDDVVFGTVLFGRMQGGEGAHRALGMFINTLPIRIDLSARDARRSLRETHAALAGLLHHEHASLALAQRCSGLPSATPLFSTLLNYRYNLPSDQSASGSDWEGLEVVQADERTNYPITLSVDDMGEDFQLVGLVDKSVGAQRLCEYMLAATRALLAALADHPQQALGAIDLLGERERQQLRQWGERRQRFPDVEPVHRQIERQVAAHPDAGAVVFEETTLSYGELNSQANRLAHYLIKRGVGPETRVGIAVERSPAMVVSLLAILKAGAAYVPLDPAYPAQRLAYLLADSGIALLLTQRGVREQLPPGGPVEILTLDDLPLNAEPAHNPDVAVHGDHLAYVIYTSGSTGNPKGVQLSHRNIARLLRGTEPWFRFGADDVWTLFHSYAFDFSVWELFGALSSGGQLIIVPYWVSRSPDQFLQLLRRHRVTVLNQTPSAFGQLLNVPGLYDQPLSLRAVIFGGEALDPQRLAPWIEHWGDRHPQLINMYGITETTVHVTYRRITRADLQTPRSPVGTALPDLGLRVLDGALNPAPIGVAGELYVAGEGQARGYLHRAGLSAERFIADPASASGERLYRTGDLVRWTSAGELDYLGRIDHQVKVRGFRIELGEIEARLLAQAAVREAVVVARADAGDTRLVGYIAGHAGAALDVRAVRDQLSRELPDYMVPSALMVLERLPLNANGKVDRAALPASVAQSDYARSREHNDEHNHEHNYEPPQGDVEIALAAIWAEVLGVERVGRHDNFFELGGHSLLALRLLERMRIQGWNAQVRTLFQQPLLSRFAREVVDSPLPGTVTVPPNLIPAGCVAIEPRMLTLVDLDAEQIRAIEASVPGGAPNIQDIYPLTPLQEGMLFHHLLQREGDAYVTAHTLSFDSKSRLERFITSFNRVIGRHDILRTAVLWEGLAVPVQVVYRCAQLPVDWLASDAQALRAGERLDAFADPRRFRIDVRRAPMFHAVAVDDGPGGRWMLRLLGHHLVDDNTSVKRLIEEIALIHQGREQQLPEPLPFRNFVAQSRTGVSAVEHEQFFRSMLGDVTEATAPYGLLDIQGEGHDIDEVQLPLAMPLALRIRQQAQHYGVSSATLFHLAWAMVLARIVGRDDVVFGTVLFGRLRSDAGADQALGMFINTLPLRVNLKGLSVEQSLRQTHALLTELIHHEHASLALAQRCSGMSDHAPLFSTLLNYRYTEQQSDETVDQAWEGIEVVSSGERTNYPLGVSVNDLGQGFELVMLASNTVDAGRLCEYLKAAIEGLTTALEQGAKQAVVDISLLGDAERQQLQRWGENRQRFAGVEPVQRLIERQAQASPDATALLFEATALSYGELNTQANRLAQRLIKCGVRPETRVGIAVERSPAMVVGLLAILKAGGAYVPLDPALPSERLAYMLDDSGIGLLLTQREVRERIPVGGAVEVLLLDALDVSDEPVHNPDVPLHGDNLAYVIYTSGSTGQPKGAAIRHRALASCMTWMQQTYDLTRDDAVLHKAPFGFDVSVWEIFWPLTAGVRLVLASPGDQRDPERIIELIRRHGITTLNFVPAMLQAFLAHAGIETQTRLRYVICGGEAMPAATQREALRRLDGVSLQNLYGPTETTIHVTQWRCRDDGRSQVPIGRPLAETRARVLDASLNLAPPGTAGELYIGGELLGRGYLNRAGLSAERFIADPFDPAGGRLYRSGDLVRWNHEGQLEYLGRIDHQVKVRGLRIELGEIEAQLLAQPAVREAVVVAQAGATGPRLVGYVSAVAQQEIVVAELRERLRRQLPDYMVPGAIVVLDRLPLNANGKVDRNALPAAEFASERTYEAPQGATEVALATIWGQVLGLERVGRHDNFFELGGDSIAALRVVALSTSRNLPGLTLTLRDLISQPTIDALCSRCAPSPSRSLTLLNRRMPEREPLFCIHSALGTVLGYLPLAKSLDGIRSVYGIACKTLVDPTHRDVSLDTMADAYVESIRSMQGRGPYHLLGWSLGGILAALVAERLEGVGQEVRFLGLVDPPLPSGLVRQVASGSWRAEYAYLLARVGETSEQNFRIAEGFCDPLHSEQPLLEWTRSLLRSGVLCPQGQYVGLTAEDLVRTCLMSRSLGLAAERFSGALRPVVAPVHCWWSKGRQGAVIDEVSGQLQSAHIHHTTTDVDHESIVASPVLLASLRELMTQRQRDAVSA